MSWCIDSNYDNYINDKNEKIGHCNSSKMYEYNDTNEDSDKANHDNHNPDKKIHNNYNQDNNNQTNNKHNDNNNNIFVLTIIGEIEGHDELPNTSKSTKYEHILPELARIEDDETIEGLLIILNTMGGDVSAGLALAEMIASMTKPSVSLIIGDSHSIGVPLAVSTDYSFIVPSATMILHPVRMSGMVIGAPQTYQNFTRIQERIISFIATHCDAKSENIEKMMLNSDMMIKDLGTILVGEQAVKAGLVNEVGGISQAFDKLKSMIELER